MRSQLIGCPKCGKKSAATTKICRKCGIDRAWAIEHWGAVVSGPQDHDAPLILIVDDDIGVLTMVEITLKRAGYRIAKAHNATEALDLAPRLLPALIATDVMMPGMDGIEFIRSLKANPTIQNIPMFVLSACGDSEAIDRGIKAGASMYLTLPPPRDALLEAVKSLLHDRIGQITHLADQIQRLEPEVMAVAS
jgi:CheY-like chemotaxis protein